MIINKTDVSETDVSYLSSKFDVAVIDLLIDSHYQTSVYKYGKRIGSASLHTLSAVSQSFKDHLDEYSGGLVFILILPCLFTKSTCK